MRSPAERTKGKGASDRTNYGRKRISARSFLEHHTQRVSLAAVMYDAIGPSASGCSVLAKKQTHAAHVARGRRAGLSLPPDAL